MISSNISSPFWLHNWTESYVALSLARIILCTLTDFVRLVSGQSTQSDARKKSVHLAHLKPYHAPTRTHGAYFKQLEDPRLGQKICLPTSAQNQPHTDS